MHNGTTRESWHLSRCNFIEGRVLEALEAIGLQCTSTHVQNLKYP